MKYTGSKRRIAKEILPIMLKKRGSRVWVEPFVGGANLIDKVEGRRIGSDSNHYLIALLKALQNGWLPPTTITEKEYKAIKAAPEWYDPAVVAAALIGCSFGGIWARTYARNAGRTNYALRFYNNVKAQAPNLKGIEFYACSYDELVIPPNCLIYCDPPYAGANYYKDEFDHDRFWEWCRKKSREGHIIYVSEYNAPDDFLCVWQKEISANLNNQTAAGAQKKAVEKLFTYDELF